MTKHSLFEFDKKILHPSEGVNLYSEESQAKRCFGHCPQHDAIIIGTDEAGRGPGAGGVFASAVCFNNITPELIEKFSDLNDSKKLSKKKREELYDLILENTINSTVCVEVEEIEKINILQASLKAMRLACENVIETRGQEGKKAGGQANIQQKTNVLVLVDGNKLIKDFPPSPEFLRLASSPRTSHFSPLTHLPPHLNIKQQCIIKGDARSASIAAASILAKVSRDRYMEELHKKFPQYNWAQNAGYLTAEHLSAIDKYGVTPYHRRSFLKKHEEKCNINQLNLYQK